MYVLIGIAVVALLVLGLFMLLFNRLVALRQRCGKAFHDIDIYLRHRHDLIPQLVEVVKGYAGHEKNVLENVTVARAGAGEAVSASKTERARAEGALGTALVNLLSVAEAYPDLKADASFQRLMGEVAEIEDRISAARRYFNSATAEYNTGREQFPANIIANRFGFEAEHFFELDEAVKRAVQEPPKISFSN